MDRPYPVDRGDLPSDIETARLLLCCLHPESIRSGLLGDRSAIERQLAPRVPAVFIRDPAVLKFAAPRLADDPDYLPWSPRAILLKDTRHMISHLPFHTLAHPRRLTPSA